MVGSLGSYRESEVGERHDEGGREGRGVAVGWPMVELQLRQVAGGGARVGEGRRLVKEGNPQGERKGGGEGRDRSVEGAGREKEKEEGLKAAPPPTPQSTRASRTHHWESSGRPCLRVPRFV